MRDVLKTNNAVLLNFAQVLLADAGIEAVVFDGHMSVMDGSLGILPRRLMVSDGDFSQAERVLKDGLPDDAPPA
jgi:Putative prokaryotic signal transducing protein